MGRETGSDFIEALARGLDVLRCFRPGQPTMTLSEIAAVTGLARPTVRRILLTLEELGYVRAADRGFALTPRVLELGVAYVNSLGVWDVARPHMRQLVTETGESTSLAQLDGSDIVYVSRVAVPKIVTLAVTIGTRFPAVATSMGKVLLAALTPAELTAVLAVPGRSGIDARWRPDRDELDRELREVRARGWGPGRPGPGRRHPVGRHRGPRRRRPGGGRAQRHRARRRDLTGTAHRRAPAPPAAHRRRDQPGLGGSTPCR